MQSLLLRVSDTYRCCSRVKLDPVRCMQECQKRLAEVSQRHVEALTEQTAHASSLEQRIAMLQKVSNTSSFLVTVTCRCVVLHAGTHVVQCLADRAHGCRISVRSVQR